MPYRCSLLFDSFFFLLYRHCFFIDTPFQHIYLLLYTCTCIYSYIYSSTLIRKRLELIHHSIPPLTPLAPRPLKPPPRHPHLQMQMFMVTIHPCIQNHIAQVLLGITPHVRQNLHRPTPQLINLFFRQLLQIMHMPFGRHHKKGPSFCIVPIPHVGVFIDQRIL